MIKDFLDRSIAPPIQTIPDIKLTEVKSYHLDNGIVVRELNMGTQEVMKMEVVFYAGRPFETKPLVSRATIGLLKEGTLSQTSAQIAETVDFYGASLSTPFNLDTSNIVLYTLNKHFETLLPLLAEIIVSPSFPEHELNNFINRSQQRLKIDLSKPDVIAYRTITELIFGAEHPYGYNSYADNYGSLQRSDLVQHFERNFKCNNCLVFVSGKLPKNAAQLLNKYIGQLVMDSVPLEPILKKEHADPQKIRIPHPESVQSAIRVGKRMFSRKHPDYPGMFILNTILGGYFGSRLMANIREENAYTYNIYSSLDYMIQDGYFYIGTEVGTKFVEPTLKEIYKEMEILQSELVEEEELDMVKNYLMGTLLMSLDGPFHAMDVQKSLVSDQLSIAYFNTLVHTIQHIRAEDLQALAKKYFQPDSFWEVVVGA